MIRRRILYVSCVSLKDVRRGTPLRIKHILDQIQKNHDLHVCVPEIDHGSFKVVKYPKGGFRKLWNLANYIKRNGIEIVLTSTESAIKLPVFLKLLTDVKIVMDLHGVAAEERDFLGRFAPLRKWLYERMVLMFLKRYDLLLPVSKKLGERYSSLGVRTRVVYGGVNEAMIGPFPHVSKQSAGTAFTIAYAGNTGFYQGIPNFLESLNQIHKEGCLQVRALLILSNDEESIKKRVADLGLTTVVEVRSRLPYDETQRVLRSADALIVPRPRSVAADCTFPSKLPEYLATGIPVITSDAGPVREFLSEDDHTCILVSQDDIVHSVKEGIERLYHMTEEARRDMGSRAIALVRKKFAWPVIGDQINASLSEDVI